jgi:MFS family permease
MRRLDSLNNNMLVFWGLILSAAVFFGYSLATDYRQIIPIQVVLGFAWSFLYVGSLRTLLENNVERASAAGLLNSTINLAGIVGPLISGFITAFASFGVAFVFSGFLCIAGILYKIPESKT